MKGRPCHPELTDLLGTSCRCMWSRGHGRAAMTAENSRSGCGGRSSPSLAAVNSQGCKGKLLEPSGRPLALEGGQVSGRGLHDTA